MSGSTNKVSREKAIADFKAKNAAKYTTKFDREPTRRPDYIPQGRTERDGSYRPVYYDQQRGGYGYWDALGTFIIYDALTDAAQKSNPVIINTAAPNGVTTTTTASAHRNSGSSAGSIFGVLVVLAVVGGVVIYVARRRNSF